MVYPALTWLEEVGYAQVTTEGAKKRYAITDAGREHLEQHHEVADAILSELEHIARRLGRLRTAFSGFEAQEGQDHSDGVWSARRQLKEALRARAVPRPRNASESPRCWRRRRRRFATAREVRAAANGATEPARRGWQRRRVLVDPT